MIVITMSCQSQYVRMFDGVSLKCMLTRHTDYLENKNMALHVQKVSDHCSGISHIFQMGADIRVNLGVFDMTIGSLPPGEDALTPGEQYKSLFFTFDGCRFL